MYSFIIIASETDLENLDYRWYYMQNMVYLHFPLNLTEEELMLQNKYNKLKRKVQNEVMFMFLYQVQLSGTCILHILRIQVHSTVIYQIIQNKL